MKKRILVFAEQGADALTMCGALRLVFARCANPPAIVPVTAAQMREAGMMAPARTIGFVLPGASDADYDRKLGPDNIRALRDFVQDGGRFLGVCAGAYYACKTVEWYGWDSARAKRKNPGIDFFDYAANGPIRPFLAAQDVKTKQDRSLSHCAVADITWHDGKYERRGAVMYWGGPQFSGFSHGRILARFNDLAGKPPAIVMAQIGKGSALISSVHPEIGGDNFAQAVYGDSPLHHRARDIGRRLREQEAGRQDLWRNLVGRLFPEYGFR